MANLSITYSSPKSSTCSSTFARSTGAVTSVVGTAERKPATASSGIDRASVARLGVTTKINFFEASYAYETSA